MPDVPEEVLIETLSAYVPGLVLRGLASDPTPISEPTAERFAAAVMFVDITGFTAIGERLAKHGFVGAEELAQLLNDCFGQLIDIIHHYGGEVTKFAGDALLALWPVPEGVVRLSNAARIELVKVAYRAAQCGMAMQKALHNNEAAQRENFSLQVGIGAGDVYSIHLGGVFHRWEFLLSGAPLVQISQAKDLAIPGEVVLSPEVWDLLKRGCHGRFLKNGFVELDKINKPVAIKAAQMLSLSPKAKKGLLSYIPAAVTNRLAAGHEEWLSEMRQVTVMFIKLPSYGTSITHPYVQTIPKAQAVMEALQTRLYYYAGSINKLNVDEKGITLVAGLGLPPLPHKDDAARAVHAALEMQTALKELGRSSVIGITTGYVYCGPIGNKWRREYTMVGNVVNLAARLMQAAEASIHERRRTPGEITSDILVDENTYQVIQEQIARGQELASQLSLQRLPAVRVKGKIEPVPVYRPQYRAVTRGRQHLSRHSFYIGRETEQAILQRVLAANEAKSASGRGDSTVYFIEGEAGIGKTLLLEDLVRQAKAGHIPYLYGAGRALDRIAPFHAWRPVFHELFSLDDVFSDPASQRAHVLGQLPTLRNERGFPGFALQLSALLNPVLPFNFPESDVTAAMALDERQRTTQQFLLRLIENEVVAHTRRSSRPYLLVMDSGQWLDSQSWELLRLVSRRIPSLYIVVATRPLFEERLAVPLPDACRYFMDPERVEYLSLSLLSQDQIAAVLCSKEGIGDLPEAMRVILAGRTGGHPLYSEELITHWQSKNLVEKTRSGYEIVAEPEALAAVSIPERVQKAITGRLDNLPPTELLLLKTAGTIGVNFTLSELEMRYPIAVERPYLSEAIAHLERLQLIRPVNETANPAYTFIYGCVQEVAYSLLPYSFRERLDKG
jgi:class 3 adenylate cyclase